MIEGRIARISGPIVYAEGLSGCGLYDVVSVGEASLIGEIIRLNAGRATIQVYEDGTGMRVGEKVVCHQRPLSVRLGPGLVGTIYDGIQRPLDKMFDERGPFIVSGQQSEPLDIERRWQFEPVLTAGAAIGPGSVVGTVQETASILHKVMVPPTIKGKTVVSVVATGEYTVSDVVAKTELGEEICMSQYWPVRKPRPYNQKLNVAQPLVTGQRVIDVLFPISKGGAASIPGGFGTGKTMTQHAIAKWCDADLIVYIGCGERGNEMTDVLREFPTLIDPRTGRSLMERTILIANTSNMPVAAREASLYSGITLAEYYRDMGMAVAVMADSTSRWAEALRELSGRMEEMPAEEGFPAYLPTRLAEFYERAGRVKNFCDEEGSITVIGAVSPPGGDFSEPVVQHTMRFTRCFWALDRELANARHYPAIGWIASYSEYIEEVKEWWNNKEPRWATIRLDVLDLLKREQQLEKVVRLIGPDAVPESDRLLLLVAEMIKIGFLQQSAFDAVDVYSVPEKQIGLLQLIMGFYYKGQIALNSGIPLSSIRKMAVYEEIIRAKSVVPNDKLEMLDSIKHNLDEQFGELERAYRKVVS